jgi:hypothetical protein
MHNLVRELGHAKAVENHSITARELQSCMWTRKFVSKLTLLVKLVRRFSPTTKCYETSMQEVEKSRIKEPLGLEDS